MALQLPVYVIGFSDVYREFFNAIAATVGNADYGILIKLMVMLGGTWTILLASFKKDMTLNIRWVINYCLITSLLLVPSVTIVLIDRVSNKAETIQNVPLGLGVLASTTSRIGTGFTELIESVFHTPDDLSYSQSGMLMGSKMISAASQFQVIGGNFQKNLQGFVKQCVFYDVLLHKYTLEDLVNAQNLWSWVTNKASPARAFIYNDQVTTCAKGAISLSKDWESATNDATNQYARLLFGDNEANAKTQLLSYLPLSYQYLTGLSEDAATLMQQNMMIQALQDGMGEWASGINAQTALADFAYAKAQQQKRMGYGILFRLAVYWLPLTKAVMELILLGSFLIIVLFAFFPFGGSVLKNYVYTFVWLQLWAPIFAFENFILTYYGSHLLKNATILSDGSQGITLSTYSVLNQMNSDLGTLAGFFAAMTPLLAIGIFKGMMSVFSQAASYIGGAIQTAAISAAGEAVTGNMSLGNTQFSTHSAYNTSAYHLDTNPKIASGMMTYQLTGGGTASVAADGEVILNSQSAISQLPVTPHMAKSMALSYTHMADKAETTSLRESNSAQAFYSAALRNLYELGNTHSQTEASGETRSISDSGSFSSAARQAHQLVDRFAHENNISHAQATQTLGSWFAAENIQGSIDTKRAIFGKIASWATGISANASITGGHKNERSSSHNDTHSELMSRAQSFSNETNFGQTVERAYRAAEESNFRTGSENSDRIAKSMASSFEQGERYAHDAVNSFEQSQSYRQQASLVENQSVGINTQATQEFVDWLQHQPSIRRHGGGMGSQEIMQMMQRNLPMAEEYANQFVQEKERGYMRAFEANYAPEQVSATFRNNNQNLVDPQSIQTQQQQNDQTIKQGAAQVYIGQTKDSVTPVTDSLINQASKGAIDQHNRKGKNLATEVNHAIDKKG